MEALYVESIHPLHQPLGLFLYLYNLDHHLRHSSLSDRDILNAGLRLPILPAQRPSRWPCPKPAPRRRHRRRHRRCRGRYRRYVPAHILMSHIQA